MLKSVEFFSRFTYPQPTLVLHLDPMLYYYPKQNEGIFFCNRYEGIGEYDGANASVFTTGGYAYPTKKAKTSRNISFAIKPADGTAAYCKREVARRLPKEEVLIKMTTTENVAYWTRAWLGHASFPTWVNGVVIVLDFVMQVDYFVKETPIFKSSSIGASSFTADYPHSGPVVGGLYASGSPAGGATLGSLDTNQPHHQFGACGCLGNDVYKEPAFFTYMWRPAQISWPYSTRPEDIVYDSAINPGSTWLYQEVSGSINPPIGYNLSSGWSAHIYATDYVL